MKYFFRNSFFVIIYIYLYIPIVILILNSFNKSRFGNVWNGLTIDWYKTLWTNTNLLEAALHSLVIATTSATFATLMGLITAVVLFRYKFKWKPFIGGIIFVIMMLPDIVMAISLLLLFVFLKIPLGFFSLFFSHVIFCLPFVVIVVYSRLKDFDLKILEAAIDLGASEFRILQKIIFPLALPAIIASWLLSFMLSIDDVVVSFFVTGPNYEVLPLKIYSMVKTGTSPEINVLITIFLLLSFILFLFSLWISKKYTYKYKF